MEQMTKEDGGHGDKDGVVVNFDCHLKRETDELSRHDWHVCRRLS